MYRELQKCHATVSLKSSTCCCNLLSPSQQYMDALSLMGTLKRHSPIVSIKKRNLQKKKVYKLFHIKNFIHKSGQSRNTIGNVFKPA